MVPSKVNKYLSNIIFWIEKQKTMLTMSEHFYIASLGPSNEDQALNANLAFQQISYSKNNSTPIQQKYIRRFKYKSKNNKKHISSRWTSTIKKIPL